MFDGPQTSVATRRPKARSAAATKALGQAVVRVDEIGRPMVDGFDAALRIDRAHDLLQPAHGLVPIECAGQADIDVAGRMVRHDAEAFAAREVRHRGGGSERKRGVLRFGKGRGRHLERKGGGLVQRIDAGPLDLARVCRLAGKMQPGAQEAAAAHDDAVVAGIAQRHGVGRPRDGFEIGAHAAEAAGMLVGVEQHVHRTAQNRRLGQVSRDVGQDSDARFGIGRAATQQPPAAHGAAERRLGPLIKVARRGGIDAGIEAKHGTGRGTRDLDQHGDVLAFAVTQQTRLQMIVCEPGMDDAKHRLRRIDAAARRRRHQPRRQLHDAVDRRRAHGAG